MKVSRLGQRNDEMLKPDLKGKNNKDYPTVRIRFESDWRAAVLSYINASVMNLLRETD
jgi:hypothetical protein